MSCNTGDNKDKPLAGCQYKASTNPLHKVMGLPDKKESLEYWDGFLNLTYVDGESCHNGIKRRTQIMLTCNYSAGVGLPVYEKETSCGYYHFVWETKYACLPKVIICTIVAMVVSE